MSETVTITLTEAEARALAQLVGNSTVEDMRRANGSTFDFVLLSENIFPQLQAFYMTPAEYAAFNGRPSLGDIKDA